MIAQIVGSIRGFQVICVWKDRVADFEGELNDLKERAEMDANGSGDDREKELRNKLKGVRGRITRLQKNGSASEPNGSRTVAASEFREYGRWDD